MSPVLPETSSALVPLAFLWVSFIIELTPGPNMTYLAVLSLVDGRRAGFAMVAGIASGLLVIGILAAFGIAAFVAESKFVFALLRWFGVAYMVWLAYDIWSGGEPSVHHDGQSQSIRTYFGRGFITNVLNPKAAVFYIAVLPQFVDPGRNILQQTLALSVAYAGVATIVHAMIVLLASTMRPSLQNADRMRMTRRILAISLLFVAIWLAWSSAEPGSQISRGR